MPGPEWLNVCSFVFGREYDDFLLCFDARSALSLFTVNDPCQLPSVNFGMSLRSTVRRVRSQQETRPSGTLTYVLAILRDIRTSFCALIRRRTIFTNRWAGCNAGYASVWVRGGGGGGGGGVWCIETEMTSYTECKNGGSLGRPGSSCAKARLMRPREFCFDCAS